ncbi:DUF6915 family protein [Streptomyces sp. NBC_01197]|uniref:DUF6915 family protein n=1 Tax=Streptomyces sp. NBC_01197 TaxID=2903768 RepID=UPI002E115E17|nr:hypothetical protein OG452_05255 [Streptomyces sp. NBC_01197]
MNSWNHAVSAAKKWGGEPEHYLPIEEFIDSSKKVLGDARHRSMYHHTLGVWLVQEVFGPTLDIPKGTPGSSHTRTVSVPTRLVAERHIIEDLGWLPSPADYIENMPIAAWMSGSKRKEVPLSHLLLNQPTEASV